MNFVDRMLKKFAYWKRSNDSTTAAIPSIATKDTLNNNVSLFSHHRQQLCSTPLKHSKVRKVTRFGDWLRLRERKKYAQLLKEHLTIHSSDNNLDESGTKSYRKEKETNTEQHIIELSDYDKKHDTHAAVEKVVITDKNERQTLLAKFDRRKQDDEYYEHERKNSASTVQLSSNDVSSSSPVTALIRSYSSDHLPDSVIKFRELSAKNSKYYDDNWLADLRKKFRETKSDKLLSQEEKRYQEIKVLSKEKRERIEKILKKREYESELKFSLYSLYIDEKEKKAVEEAVKEAVVEEEEELVEINEEMSAVIERVLNEGESDDEVIVNEVRRKDLQTLLGLNWLNDEIINEYFALIERKFVKEVKCLNTFFYKRLKESGFKGVKRWTKKFDLFSFRLVLIPIHLDIHWTLISIDMHKKKITFYDSMNSSSSSSSSSAASNHLKTIRKYLSEEYKDKKGGELNQDEWICEEATKIPLQLNGSDCGMFCCKYAHYLANQKAFTFNQERKREIKRVISNLRKVLCNEFDE
ncbi:sentrin-specific protease 1-like protein [Dinothrombium tinctorium]|uniref:Sentrin-specific protease 1-like protein n=1 Tax=Dinothrombium tinctorium TaxID=1965070 RepID=A0A3S3PC68_9ACAR|nr:sentrin-specific protease 1-like protein [Dinothrombium tinctorium]RWS14250.1 sentrin-specific protease 1-like protein [Dinothrombium tinctorium]RWS16581.1 sentrin-specific protease 1-like protein [Dinothrombium tinctorium]RWS16589.1 sentrin-specific protease 1-like protein [Dinothrombium tinctorium]